jgi:hypothetical protein
VWPHVGGSGVVAVSPRVFPVSLLIFSTRYLPILLFSRLGYLPPAPALPSPAISSRLLPRTRALPGLATVVILPEWISFQEK